MSSPRNSDLSIDSQNAHVTPERVKALADKGQGRNEVMRTLGASQHHVDKAARAAGVTWDRTWTRKAVETLSVDAALEREQLGQKFRTITHTILDRIINAEDIEPEELRTLLWSAGSATASDARYAKAGQDARVESRLHGDGEEVSGMFAEMLSTLRNRYAISETAEEDLTCDYCQLVECSCGRDDSDDPDG